VLVVVVVVVVIWFLVKIKSSKAPRPIRNNKIPIIDARQQQFEHVRQIPQIRRRRFLLRVSVISISAVNFFVLP
jgi:hypothetical protein